MGATAKSPPLLEREKNKSPGQIPEYALGSYWIILNHYVIYFRWDDVYFRIFCHEIRLLKIVVWRLLMRSTSKVG